MPRITRILHYLLFGLLAAGPATIGTVTTAARAAEPLTIGFDTEATGGLAPNGKAALLAMEIWVEDTNAKGGLLGRPVKLVTYDDQSNPARFACARAPSSAFFGNSASAPTSAML